MIMNKIVECIQKHQGATVAAATSVLGGFLLGDPGSTTVAGETYYSMIQECIAGNEG